MTADPADKKHKDELLRIVNGSGFGLQIAVEHLVRTKGSGWKVRCSEHAWRTGDGQVSGFIDVVLVHQKEPVALVVECKRVQNADWVFLQETEDSGRCRRARVLRVWKLGGRWLSGPVDSLVYPWCTQSRFCAVKGESRDKTVPMLERIAGGLLQACECLASEEQPIIKRTGGVGMYYVPVIVTTATLHVCVLAPEQISITDGKAPDSVGFAEVPYVRFHKQLAPHRVVDPPAFGEDKWNSVAQAKEDTVFIVNSSNLVGFLQEFAVDRSGIGAATVMFEAMMARPDGV